jgi:hypothetical protein
MKTRNFNTALVLCFTLACPISSAQVRVGLTGGFNIPRISGENIITEGLGYGLQGTDISQSVNVYGGVLADIPIKKWVSFQPEVLYSQSAYAWYSPNQMVANLMSPKKMVSPDYAEVFRFISVPLSLNFKIRRVSILAGWQYNKFLSAKRWYEDETTDVNDEYNMKANYSALIGIAFTTKEGAGVHLRWQQGLSDLTPDYPTGIYEKQHSIVNSTIMLGGHLLLKVKKNRTKNKNK